MVMLYSRQNLGPFIFIAAVMVLFLVALSGSCFSMGDSMGNACHLRIYLSSSADAPIRELFFIMAAFTVLALAFLKIGDGSPAMLTADPRLKTLARDIRETALRNKVYDPLFQFLRQGRLHPKLDA